MTGRNNFKCFLDSKLTGQEGRQEGKLGISNQPN